MSSNPRTSPKSGQGSTDITSSGRAHQLNSEWVLYYHDPEDNDWTIGSYTRVGVFRTIEQFWGVVNKLPKHSFHLGMFFIMRESIRPMWEDSLNCHGGCWSYKININDVFTLWINLSVHLVSEMITEDPYLINGISISPKKGFCIVKIWNRDHTKNDSKYICSDIPLDHTQSLYTPFKEK